MRLKLVDTIALVVLMVLLFASSVLFLICCFNASFAGYVMQYLTLVLTGKPIINRILLGLICIVIGFFVVRILFVRKPTDETQKTGENKKKTFAETRHNNGMILIRSADNGEAYIQTHALLDMAQQVVSANDKVQSCQASVTSHEEQNVALSLEVVPVQESELPALSEELQNAVTTALEEKTGVKLTAVTVLFTAAAPERNTVAHGQVKRKLR